MLFFGQRFSFIKKGFSGEMRGNRKPKTTQVNEIMVRMQHNRDPAKL